MWGRRSQDSDDDNSELKGGTEPLTEEETPLVAEKVSVLCWIMTGPKTHQTKVR